MSRRYTIIAIIVIFLILPFSGFIGRIAYAVIHGSILQLMGYPVDIAPWELAEQIIETKKDPSYCFELQQSIPVMGPTIESKRTHCVFEYAKLANEPSACSLLMPSEYGLDCIGEIWGKATDQSNCHWYKNNAVRCFEGSALTPHIYECTASGKAMIDECWHRIAFKEKDPERCDSIKNEILRSVCKVRIKTWESYPELRSTIYFNDDIQ